MFGAAKCGAGLRGAVIQSGISILLTISAVVFMGSASAQGLRSADLATVQSGQFETGEQLALSRESGTISFAGHEVKLSSFAGIIGFASDVAYIVTLEGSAAAGPDVAERGEMLLFPPMGMRPLVERFDAARLRDGWGADERAAMPGIYASLDQLADKQEKWIFFGRLGATNFNVAASGEAKGELARRTIVGDDALRDLRFADFPDRQTFEAAVVQSFVDALAGGDVKSVAALMDPEPYGNTDLRGGGGDARLMMAEALLAERDWSRVLSGAADPAYERGSTWAVNSGNNTAFITLRPLGDLSYVESVYVGGK